MKKTIYFFVTALYLLVSIVGRAQVNCAVFSNTTANDTVTIYAVTPGGFLGGNNGYQDLAAAEKFTTVPGSVVDSAGILFLYATMAVPAAVNIYLYDASGTGGTPGNAIDSTQVALSDILLSTQGPSGINVAFNHYVPLSSADFFIVVQFPEITGDTVAVGTTTMDCDHGRGYIQDSYGTWYTADDLYALTAPTQLGMFIFPYICTNTQLMASATGSKVCGVSCTGTAAAQAISGTPPYTYLWNTVPPQTTAIATGICPGTYTVTITDLANATATASAVVDSVAPVSQNLCMVTSDSASTYNLVIWEKADRAASQSFNIYRENTPGNYTVIGNISNDSLSQFIDNTINPLNGPFKYKISVIDTCGTEGPLSPYHETVVIHYLGSGTFELYPYQIENSGTLNQVYNVYRDSLATGDWQLQASYYIAQDTAFVTYYDTTFAYYPGALYRAEAILSYSCSPARASFNTIFSNTTPQLIFMDAAQQRALPTISVYPNPTNNVLNIKTSISNAEKLVIYDVNGRKVFEKAYQPYLNIEQLNSGVYFVELHSANEVARTRFVKN